MQLFVSLLHWIFTITLYFVHAYSFHCFLSTACDLVALLRNEAERYYTRDIFEKAGECGRYDYYKAQTGVHGEYLYYNKEVKKIEIGHIHVA